MNRKPEDPKKILQQFDAWLRQEPLASSSELRDRILSRVNNLPRIEEETFDELFKINPQLRVPDMTDRIRRRLREAEEPVIRPAAWFSWLTPVAATLVLGVAFFSFRQEAPESVAPARAYLSRPFQEAESASTEDTELTRIFALASNLHSPADMADFKSVDDLAFLFH